MVFVAWNREKFLTVCLYDGIMYLETKERRTRERHYIMKYYEDPKFARAFRKIAVRFIVRCPNNPINREDDANDEVDMIIKRVGLEKLAKESERAYVYMSRAGLRIPLNRRIRKSIALSLDNAMNHASIEVGYY